MKVMKHMKTLWFRKTKRTVFMPFMSFMVNVDADVE